MAFALQKGKDTKSEMWQRRVIYTIFYFFKKQLFGTRYSIC